MTAREVYRHILSELNEVSVSTLLLEDFNYYINKAIYQFGNKKYNVYDKNQQITDDLRVLTKKAILEPINPENYDELGIFSIYDSSYIIELPEDYWHILNCVCNYELETNVGCLKKGTNIQYKAKKLTADIWPEIIDNYYFKPRFDRPYYYLNGFGEGSTPEHKEEESQNSRLIKNGKISLQDIKAEKDFDFLGNPYKINMEIRCGEDKRYNLNKVYIDYIKVPQTIKLTTRELDLVQDTSQILEFPDYTCFEIINELGKLLLENLRDPRLSTNLPVNVSIAPPLAQQETNKK